MRFVRYLAAVAATAIGPTLGAAPAQAYPIDCAILLCLAGGFPPSAECTAAKIEFIRRITPWPIEPPLQLWRCPMGISAETASLIGITPPQLGRDGLTPEVRAYRDGIEIYHIVRYSRRKTSEGDEIVTDVAQRGYYDETGAYHWAGASYERGPAWLADAVGGRRIAITRCLREHDERGCVQTQVVGTENRNGRRGIAMRYRDHSGAYHMEFVAY